MNGQRRWACAVVAVTAWLGLTSGLRCHGATIGRGRAFFVSHRLAYGVQLGRGDSRR